jgi:hypothetical protein
VLLLERTDYSQLLTILGGNPSRSALALKRKRQQKHVQRPLRKLAYQSLSLGFQQIETQVRVGAVKFRQQ